jgi:hypothetical protein
MMEDNGFATGYAVGRDSTNGGGYGNNGLFGNDWAWIVILLLFGWGGNRGFGGFGGGFGGGSCGYAPCATQADVRAAVDQQTLISKIDQQTYGLADSFTALNNTLNNNFRGIDNAICTLGYQALQNTNAVQTQLSDCCCGIKGEIKDVAYGNEKNAWTISKQISDCCCDLEKMNLQNRFDMQTYNCNTLQAIDASTDRIIKYLADEKTQALRDENMALRLAASQAKQNEYLIARLGDKCPEPAYIVQPPQQVTFPTNCCGTVNYAGYNNGCGCGNF